MPHGSDRKRPFGCLSASRPTVASQGAAPYVLADVWPQIAKAALAAEGNSLAAWLRIGMVSRVWRESVAGVCNAAWLARLNHYDARIRRPRCCLLCWPHYSLH